jgi:hypothetical protein
MKIAASSLSQESRHLFRQEEVKQERLLAWVGDRRPEDGGDGMRPGAVDGLRISEEARLRAGRQQAPSPAPSRKSGGCQPCQEGFEEDPQLSLLRLAVEALTGRKITIRRVEVQVEGAAVEPATTAPAQAEGPARQGWGLEYDSFQSYAEEESLSYQAAGLIVTEDGREIAFALDMALSRAFYQSTEMHIRAGDARLVDPLVLNFAGNAAQLTDATFAFDLDADGQPEEIHALAGGSAFLALDKNGDGRINDGSELFGPRTGHGFSELASHDQDNNGWIDENDAVFSKLVAWIKDQDGNDQLRSVMDLGVGALSLAGLAGDFSLTTTSNETLGKIRETSVFVQENGEVGTIQELDLVV